ncbi:MAG: 3-isopropylmalate dehydratase small subunit [Caulobacteraceae bacterium]
MQPFTPVHSIAAVVPENDIDTDIIYPARFLLVMDKQGLGQYLFHDRRGPEHPGFPLDKPEVAGAQILIAGSNFGCGSSREQAVWAIAGGGFKCVIASSFGEIFYNNCFKNGLLPIRLDDAQVADLAAKAVAGAVFNVDLVARRIRGEGVEIAFPLEDGLQQRLLEGWDDIDLILNNQGEAIAAFEVKHKQAQPWLFPS